MSTRTWRSAGAVGERGSSSAAVARVVDWLVAMNRLDDTQMLDRVIRGGAPARWQLDRLAAVLVAVLSPRQCRVRLASGGNAAELWRSVAFSIAVFCSTRGFHLPPGARTARHWGDAAPVSDGARRPSRRTRSNAAYRRWPRRLASGAHLSGGSGTYHRLPGIQRTPANGRSFRRNCVSLR